MPVIFMQNGSALFTWFYNLKPRLLSPFLVNILKEQRCISNNKKQAACHRSARRNGFIVPGCLSVMNVHSVHKSRKEVVQNYKITNQQLSGCCSQRCWNWVTGGQHEIKHQRSAGKPIHKVGFGTVSRYKLSDSHMRIKINQPQITTLPCRLKSWVLLQQSITT